MRFTAHHKNEYCRCPDNYTGVDCSVLTACGDNCESHEMCIQADRYPECEGSIQYTCDPKNSHITIFS